jgi:hypothetical protein
MPQAIRHAKTCRFQQRRCASLVQFWQQADSSGTRQSLAHHPMQFETRINASQARSQRDRILSLPTHRALSVQKHLKPKEGMQSHGVDFLAGAARAGASASQSALTCAQLAPAQPQDGDTHSVITIPLPCPEIGDDGTRLLGHQLDVPGVGTPPLAQQLETTPCWVLEARRSVYDVRVSLADPVLHLKIQPRFPSLSPSS